ncbi:MAG: hypothetical protein HDS41_03285 [Bacteroides sp.]|nr:hypothetical protein [Bacteroides sp.]
MDLTGKKILFIAPKYFGIPEKIQSKLIELGASVDFFDERPGNSFLTKALIRINRNLIAGYINKYHSKIINLTRHQHYDYIFFIRGESFSEHNLKKLLNTHPESTSIVYHWDSIKNNPNALNLLNNFDYRYSFDRSDCEKFNITFLPLFYYDEYSSLAKSKKTDEYTLMFVGTTHSDRYRIITTLTKQIEKQGKKAFTYFYFQGKIMFYKYLFLHKECRDIDKTAVHFSSISNEELEELYQKSKIIIDVNHPKQSGLTIRCMETLGFKRKLVTTNSDIVNYDFYNPNNILVIDRKKPFIPNEFIDAPYENIPPDIYNKYSLSAWCSTIFQDYSKNSADLSR